MTEAQDLRHKADALVLRNLLEDRGQDYGDYGVMCAVIQRIKIAMQSSPNWKDLADTQREALELSATKIGRILSGNRNKVDSWQDVIGYFTKAIEYIPVDNHKPEPVESRCDTCYESSCSVCQNHAPEPVKGPFTDGHNKAEWKCVMCRDTGCSLCQNNPQKQCQVCKQWFAAELVADECVNCRH